MNILPDKTTYNLKKKMNIKNKNVLWNSKLKRFKLWLERYCKIRNVIKITFTSIKM